MSSTASTPTRLANAIRFLAIDAIVRAGEGHQGVPLGMAEIATALYTRHLKFDAADPTWPDRDRVVLSNGHGSMLLYALLYLSGYERIGIEQVSSFRDFGSRCEGHPEYDHASGIEVTTGPLGQGIANAFGMAVAEAYLNARFGAGVVDHRTYAFSGDGCLQEGVGQEMISLAGHLRLGKLTLLWDDNRITDDGATDLSISEDVAARFRVAGWHVVEVDGHDLEAVSAAIGAAKVDARPSLVACRTVIAKGIARLQGQRGGHSAKLFPADATSAREQLGWSSAPFEVPADVLATWRDAGRRGTTERESWHERVAALPRAERAEFERIVAGELPEGWRDVLLAYKRGAIERAPLASGIFISAEIHTSANLSRRGAYVLAECHGGPRKVTLLATGSEVALALAARDALQADGTPTAVVSMPSWELFAAQDASYRASVLGRGTVRVACEAALRFGWDRWLGEHGGFVGMTGFGASGPAEVLYPHFGITPEAIVAEARRLLAAQHESTVA